MRTKQKITSEIVLDKSAPMGHNRKLLTVVELPHYIACSEKILSVEERDAVANLIATNPLAGAVISGAGGVRKLRFAKAGRGKSGGVRIIYYYYNDNEPVLLIDMYAKNKKGNLSKSERNAMAQLIASIKRKDKK